MSKELDAQIRSCLVTIRRRKLLSRIRDIVRHYNGEGLNESDLRIKEGFYSYADDGMTVQLRYEIAEDGQTCTWRVWVDGSLVFEATSGPDLITTNTDRRRVYTSDEITVIVHRFMMGSWLTTIDLKQRIAATKREQREALRRGQRESDSEIAGSFGLLA